LSTINSYRVSREEKLGIAFNGYYIAKNEECKA